MKWLIITIPLLIMMFPIGKLMVWLKCFRSVKKKTRRAFESLDTKIREVPK